MFRKGTSTKISTAHTNLGPKLAGDGNNAFDIEKTSNTQHSPVLTERANGRRTNQINEQ